MAEPLLDTNFVLDLSDIFVKRHVKALEQANKYIPDGYKMFFSNSMISKDNTEAKIPEDGTYSAIQFYFLKDTIRNAPSIIDAFKIDFDPKLGFGNSKNTINFKRPKTKDEKELEEIKNRNKAAVKILSTYMNTFFVDTKISDADIIQALLDGYKRIASNQGIKKQSFFGKLISKLNNKNEYYSSPLQAYAITFEVISNDTLSDKDLQINLAESIIKEAHVLSESLEKSNSPIIKKLNESELYNVIMEETESRIITNQLYKR